MADNLMEDFTEFVVRKIATAKGPNRNPIMADIIREYQAKCRATPGKPVPCKETLTTYSVDIRVALEKGEYISRPVPNNNDRRHRPLTPTQLFPMVSNRDKMREILTFVKLFVWQIRFDRMTKWRAQQR